MKPIGTVQDKQKDVGLQERNSFIQAWIQLKDSIFNVLFVLLDRNSGDQQESLLGLIMESGLDYLQMLAFPFDPTIIDVWNGGDSLQRVTKLFQNLSISSYLPGVSFSTFLVMLYALVFLIVMVIADIIYVSYSFSKKRFAITWPLVLLAQLVPLLVTVFFLPITETMLSVVQCKPSPQGLPYSVMNSFPYVICWQGWHLFHSAVTLLFASIFVFICCVVALALFQPRMTSNKLMARQNSTGQVVFIINKIVCQFVFAFTPFSNTFIYCAMLFLLSGWLFWNYNVKTPYYHKTTTRFFRIASTYYFWTNLMLMLSQLLLPLGFNGGLVVWLGGIPFIFLSIVFQKNSVEDMFASSLKFRSGEDLELHLTNVLQLIQNHQKDKDSYMLLIGYIEKHKEICTEEDCPLKINRKRAVSKQQMDEKCQQLLKQVQRMYQVGMKKYPSCTKLRLSYAFFHLERTRNRNKAYQQFSKAELTEPSFQEQFIIYRFRKIIKQNLEQDEGDGSADLIQIIRFDNHISLCQQAMLLSARLHKQFWAQLREQQPDLKKLNKVGSKITQTVNAVKQNYQQIAKINNSVPEVLFNYASYLILITEQHVQGQQLMEVARKIKRDKLTNGFDDSNTMLRGSNQNDEQQFPSDGRLVAASMRVSAEQNRLGRIVSVNLLFQQLTGFPAQELCGRQLSKLLPDMLVQSHQLALTTWFNQETTSQAYFKKDQRGYLKHKSGYVHTVSYKVVYLPEAQVFIVTAKPISTVNCVLLIERSMRIANVSLGANTWFKLSAGHVSMNNNYLYDIGLGQILSSSCKQQKQETLTIQIDAKQLVLSILIKPIQIATLQSAGDGDEQDQKLHLVVKDIIGYSVEMTKIKETNLNMSRNMEGLSRTLLPSEHADFLGLYDNPDHLDDLIEGLQQNDKKQEHIFQPFQLQVKIKTMRLLNNQIKMVYTQNEEGIFSQDQNTEDRDEQVGTRFDDQEYQEKIKKAINTHIDHFQISALRWVSFSLVLTIVALLIVAKQLTAGQLQHIDDRTSSMNYKTIEIATLNQFLSAALQGNRSTFAKFAAQVQSHKVQLESNFPVSIVLSDNSKVTKTLKDSLVFIHGILLQHFTQLDFTSIQTAYRNYIYSIFDALEVAEDNFMPNARIIYGLISLASLSAICFFIFWVYTQLKIEKKRYDIMIWFLAIPIPYVIRLGSHCQQYLKNFVAIKELMDKGLGNEAELEVSEMNISQEAKDQKQEEQNKARKILINRQRKQTLISKLSCAHLKSVWIVPYFLYYSVLLLMIISLTRSKFQFLLPQWLFSEHQVNQMAGLQIGLELMKDRTVVGTKQLNIFVQERRNTHLNQATTHNLIDGYGNIADYFDSTVAQSFNKVYSSNLCSSATDQCSKILSGILTGGYLSYAKYLYNAKQQDTSEIRKANQLYVIPAFLQMQNIWATSITNSSSGLLNLLSILLYVFAITTLLAYLILWNIYLHRLNTQLNQTIQMLNMIPFKLLPKSRPETTEFLDWIIRQASKYHGNDSDSQ